MEAAGVADPPVGVAHCDHALPVAALQGGGVRLAPRQLGGADVVVGERRVDLLQLRPPRELRVDPQRVVGEQVHGHDGDDHQRGHRGHGEDQRGVRAERLVCFQLRLRVLPEGKPDTIAPANKNS